MGPDEYFPLVLGLISRRRVPIRPSPADGAANLRARERDRPGAVSVPCGHVGHVIRLFCRLRASEHTFAQVPQRYSGKVYINSSYKGCCEVIYISMRIIVNNLKDCPDHPLPLSLYIYILCGPGGASS